MKLSEWAKQNGLSYKTAWRLWRDGQLPVHASQLATGTVIIHEGKHGTGVALYARVSGHDQKAELDRQLARLTEFAVAKMLPITATVKEIGSALNGHRKGLMELLKNPDIGVIIV